MASEDYEGITPVDDYQEVEAECTVCSVAVRGER